MEKVCYVIGFIVGYLAVLCGLSAFSGAIAMWLWNWLAVSLFGASAIDFWTAWGISFASHCIDKCFRSCITITKKKLIFSKNP